jgi:hypothetical protein
MVTLQHEMLLLMLLQHSKHHQLQHHSRNLHKFHSFPFMKTRVTLVCRSVSKAIQTALQMVVSPPKLS